MVDTTPYVEYGLQTPNGEVHWGSYLGRPIDTQAERTVMALVLHKTAQECGFVEDEFVGRYRWVPRTVQRHDVGYAIDDPAIAPPVNATPQPPVEPPAPPALPAPAAVSEPVVEPAVADATPVPDGGTPDGQ